MEFKDFMAGLNDEDRRLDRVLRKFLQDKSLSEIYKLLRKGLIKVNHIKAKPENHIHCGDIISIAAFLLNSNVSSQASAENKKIESADLQIVFENQHLLIINKPYDKTVHGEKDGLYKDVLEYYKNLPVVKDSLSFKPGPLHRLDRRTTGLLVFSKSLEGARWFSDAIKNHIISKKYYALLTGNLIENCKWQDYITENDNDDSAFNTVKATTEPADNSILALSFVNPLAHGLYKGSPVTLAEFDIKTGRKHQIRSQSALHKHVLLGDSAYGAAALGKDASNPGGREFYLQAYSLSFPKDNPLGLPENIKIGLSPDFLCQLQYCEIENPGL